jgi:CHASE3 domain sensor protein
VSTDVAGLVEKIDDLIVQATTERSHYYTASVLREAASTIRALVAENERLRELFRIDGEQHATRIREMEKAHDARIAKYYEALEAKRTKLREAVEVMKQIAWSNDSKWQSDCARAFLATMEKPQEDSTSE